MANEFWLSTEPGRQLNRCCRGTSPVRVGWTTGGLSAGSFTCSNRVAAGRIALRSTVADNHL
jgi:hypothetical protein